MKPSELKADFAKRIDVRTTIHCNYNDIDWLINKCFRTDKHKDGYELPCFEEIGQTTKSINVESDGKYCLTQAHFDILQSGKWLKYSTQTFLNTLCARGIIPEGEYIIDVTW